MGRNGIYGKREKVHHRKERKGAKWLCGKEIEMGKYIYLD
jgi:hypothetical protein